MIRRFQMPPQVAEKDLNGYARGDLCKHLVTKH
jgi:hypothetical protein